MTGRSGLSGKPETECLIVQPIAEAGLRVLRQAGVVVHVASDTRMETLRSHLATARAVITRNHGLSAAELEQAPNLRVIVSHGTGVDAIDRMMAERRDIPVLSTPGANAQAVAEHTMALMLACAKSVVEADRSVRAADYGFRYRQRTVELSGRVLGLIGYGRIARRVVQLARAFGMEVVGNSRHVGAAEMRRDGVRCEQDLDRLLAKADVVSLHALPGREVYLDAERLALLKPDAILVNTARGSLLDENALASVLREGRIAAAGLDVFQEEPLAPDSPLLRCPRLLLTPHIGGSAAEALDRTAREAACRVLEALGIAWVGGTGSQDGKPARQTPG